MAGIPEGPQRGIPQRLSAGDPSRFGTHSRGPVQCQRLQKWGGRGSGGLRRRPRCYRAEWGGEADQRQ